MIFTQKCPLFPLGFSQQHAFRGAIYHTASRTLPATQAGEEHLCQLANRVVSCTSDSCLGDTRWYQTYPNQIAHSQLFISFLLQSFINNLLETVRRENRKTMYLCCLRTEGFSLERALVVWLDLTQSLSSSPFSFLILVTRLAGKYTVKFYCCYC